ncbi:MAG TPA: PAS domain S-box protein, partial [Verrucomicrobiae bacterium]|nr:PAS domain S-box protein [Verrucomicrobiae bacterium]
MRRNSPQEGNAPGPGGDGSRLRVLVVDRSPERAQPILDALQSAGLTPAHAAENLPEGLAEAVARGWDVLVTRDEQGAAVRAAVRDCDMDVPVVVARAQNADIVGDVERAFAEATARRERRRVAEQLQTSEIRFRAAMEGGFDAFFYFDCELDEQGATFRLVEVNSRGVAILGDTKESLIGKTFAELATDEDRTAYFTERFLRVYESGTPLEEEYEVRSPDISARWLHFHIVPMLGGVAVSARDITEAKESSRALRESEERLLGVIQHVPGVFFTLRPSEDRKGPLRFDFVSDTIEKLTGHTVAEFFGPDRITLQELLQPEDRPLIDRVDEKILAGEPFAIDIRIVHRDAGVNWAHLKAEPTFDEAGGVCAASGVMLDITDRKEAEEALQRLEEHLLQSHKMEAVGRLAGGVAHDFNNVLLVIRGYSHVLMSILGAGSDGWEEAKEIEIAATRASELIRHLLAFSRGQVMQNQVVDVNEILSGMQTLLAPLIGEDVELRTLLEPALGPVSAD